MNESHRFRNLLTNEIFMAHFTTEHAASSYGQDVLVRDDTGEVVDMFCLEVEPDDPNEEVTQ